MNAKLQTLENGKVINHRGLVDAETWISRRIDFLTNIYKFDTFEVERCEDVFTLRCHRNANKPNTRGGAKDVTFVLTIVD